MKPIVKRILIILGIALITMFVIIFLVKFADAFDKAFNNLAEPENCEVERDEPLTFDHAVWRGHYNVSVTVSNQP